MRRRGRRLFVLVALSALVAAGCELAVDFDRSRIDGGAPDATAVDSGGDARAEAGGDAADDADGDAAGDTGSEASTDGPEGDGGAVDARSDAADGAVDATVDAAPDGGDSGGAVDASDGATPDASLDAAPDAAALDAASDAAPDADAGDASDDASADAGACTTLSPGSAAAAVRTSADPRPAFVGGALVDGTYVLAEVGVYAGSDAGAVMAPSATLAITDAATSPRIALAYVPSTTADPQRSTYLVTPAVDAGAGHLVGTEVCPTPAPFDWPYSVTTEDGGVTFVVAPTANPDVVLTFVQR